MYIEDLNFSLWADFIERDFLDGQFRELIDKGVVNGATSNPAIFKNAILTSAAYKEQIASLNGLSPKERYEAVAVYDIQKAADILRPLFDRGDDGYVSIEVDPFLCDDAEATVDEGRRLYSLIGRPNVMIKVPATDAGYIAMETLSAEEIPVNATLVFSKEQAALCADAFERAQARADGAADSVISVFVSRFDRALDGELESKGVRPSLTGIYNAAAIYNTVGARKLQQCRVLFASTGVKGKALKPSYYIEELLAPNSVNTAPVETIEAYLQSGSRSVKLPLDEAMIEAHFKAIADAGIDFDSIVQGQINDGLSAFKDAFADILTALE